jgi:hypothetical protein
MKVRQVFIIGEDHESDKEARAKLITHATKENIFIGTEHLIHPLMDGTVMGFDDFIANLYTTINDTCFNLLDYKKDPNQAFLHHINETITFLKQKIIWVEGNWENFTKVYNRIYDTNALKNSLEIAQKFCTSYVESSDKLKIIGDLYFYLENLAPIVKKHKDFKFSNALMLDLSVIKTFETADANARHAMRLACLVGLRDEAFGFFISCLIPDAQAEKKDTAVFIMGYEHLSGVKTYLQTLHPEIIYCKGYTEFYDKFNGPKAKNIEGRSKPDALSQSTNIDADSYQLFAGIFQNDPDRVLKERLKDKLGLKNTSEAELERGVLLAAANGMLECLRALIEKIQVNINGINANGKTALHMAIIKNHYNCAKILLENGAKFDIQDKQGKTAIEYAEVNPDILALFPQIKNIL